MNPDLDFTNWKVAEEAMTTGKLEYPPVKFTPIKVADAVRVLPPDNLPPMSMHIPAQVPEVGIWSYAETGLSHFISNLSGLFSGLAQVGSLLNFMPAFLGLAAGGFGLLKLVTRVTSRSVGEPVEPRQAATWIYFSVPWIKSAPFVQFLKDRRVKIDNVHQVEDRCLIAVSAYHVGEFARQAQAYNIEYKRV